MYEEIKKVYDECLQESLLKPYFTIASESECVKESDKVLFWETTICDLYKAGLGAASKFSASLSYKQENYGDLITAFGNMKWCIVEFKKDFKSRTAEKRKFFATNKEKYSVEEVEENPEKTKFEVKMFEAMVSRFTPEQELSAEPLVHEPHFLVFGPPNNAAISSSTELLALRYWKWLPAKENPAPFKAAAIADQSAHYDDFVRYAGCLRLAKNGDFSILEDDDGNGHLDDLSVVLGILGEKLGHISTLGQFLKQHGLMTVPDAANKAGTKSTLTRKW